MLINRHFSWSTFSYPEFNKKVTSSTVQELALQGGNLQDVIQLINNVKPMFPAAHTIYCVVDEHETQSPPSEDEIRETLNAIARTLRISIVYKLITQDASNISYHDFFNWSGRTLLRSYVKSLKKLQEVFDQNPTLTLEYEHDFSTRKRQFVFPHTKIIRSSPKGTLTNMEWVQIATENLKFLHDKKVLPPSGRVCYYVEKGDYKAAVEEFKASQLTDGWLLSTVPSLVQLSVDLGLESFAKIIFDPDLLHWRIGNNVDYEDLTPIKDILDRGWQYAYEELLSQVSQISYTRFQYLLQFDSWMHPNSSRRVTCNESNYGLQYLSDEAQAEYFARFGRDRENLDSELARASKPANQMYHNGRAILTFFQLPSWQVKKFNLDVNMIDLNGSTPLIYAIEGSVKYVTNDVIDLLRLGADPNLAGNTLLPLNYSLQVNASFTVLSSLLLYGADVNQKDYDTHGKTVWPITLALAKGAKVVNLLLSYGADPTVIDEAGNTLIHLLFDSRNSSTPVVERAEVMKLLASHIDINRRNNLGDSVMHIAVRQNNVKEILEVAISCGVDVNLPNSTGHTPLMIACAKADLNNLKVLLATNQVDIKAKTKSGKSFVHFVFAYMQSSFGDLLKDEEFKMICQPYLTEDNIQFVKDECKKEMRNSVVKMVVSHILAAKFFVELGYAVKKHSFELLELLVDSFPESSEVFEFLLANGLDINAKNSVGETVLFKEVEKQSLTKNQVTKIQFLLKNGASLTEKNEQGIAPMDIDPMIEAKYVNGLAVDYFMDSNEGLPTVNLMELRKQTNN